MEHYLRILIFSLISLQLKAYSNYLLNAELLLNKYRYYPHCTAYKSLRA